MPRAAVKRSGAGFLAFAIAVLCLTYIWRIQQIFPILALLQLPSLGMLAAMGAVLSGVPWARLRPALESKPYRLLLYLVGVMILSVPTSYYQGLSFDFLRKDFLKTLLFMTLILASIRTVSDVRRLMLLQLGGMAFFLYMSISRGTAIAGKLGGANFYDANDLGMLLVCSIPMAVALIRPAEKPLLRLAGVAALAFYAYGVVLCGSRGAFLGLVGVGGYLVFRFKAVPVRLRFGAVALGLTLLVTVAGDEYWDSMKTILNPKADYNWSGRSAAGRMEIWKRGVGYMLSRPLTGVGVSAFGQAEGRSTVSRERAARGQGMKWSAAHNAFVQVGAELGITGLVLFVLMLWHTGRLLTETFRLNRTRGDPTAGVLAQALRTSLVGYVICGFFLSAAYMAYLYMLIALAIGLHQAALRQAAAAAVPAGIAQRRQRGAAVPRRGRLRAGAGQRGGGLNLISEGA